MISKPFKQVVDSVDKDNQRVFVTSRKGNTYPVKLSDKLMATDIKKGDRVVVKIIDDKLWIATDIEKQGSSPGYDEAQRMMNIYDY